VKRLEGDIEKGIRCIADGKLESNVTQHEEAAAAGADGSDSAGSGGAASA
jgi:hypothetical protein